jgi:phosphoglycerate dehydrogenase-like enzyme
MTEQPVHVLCTLRFTDAQLDRLRAVSPRLVVEQRTCRSAEEVTQALDPTVAVLYTVRPVLDLTHAPNLAWVQAHSAGVDYFIDTPLWQSSIPITTMSGIHATTIGEYVLTMMLALTYRVPRMLSYQHQTEWPGDRWAWFARHELRGQTVGIVGYGSIGREVARLAAGFGMRILAMKRSPDPADHGWRLPGTGDPEGRLPERFFQPDQAREMLAGCDFVVLALPAAPSTERFIGEAELRAMKPTAYLINIARGSVIDEAALVRALREGWIAGAGLDVFEHEPLPADSPLWQLENAILSPHVAGFTVNYDRWATELFADNLGRYLAGQPLLNLVDRKRGY